MLIVILGSGIIILDQLSKFLAQKYLPSHQSIAMVKDIFHLTLVNNTGVAFGLFRNISTSLLLLISVSVLVLVFISFPMSRTSSWKQIAFAFIVGGAVSNLIDRIRLGYVIDFLDFRVWPVFNLADTFISLGLGLFILRLLRPPKCIQ